MRLPWECRDQSQETSWRRCVTGPFFHKRKGFLKIDRGVKMTRHLGLVWELHAPTYPRLGIYVSSIGGLQPISRDTDNNIAMYNCWWTNKRSSLEIFCFRPPTWRLWRNVKTTYRIVCIALGRSVEFRVLKLREKLLACVAGGIVSAHEIKFWTSERRSREENGERDSEIRFRVPLPILLAASPLACPKLYFAGAYNTASYAG